MAGKNLLLSPSVSDYIAAHVSGETELLRRLRAETARLPMARMQIPAEQGDFLSLVTSAIGARRAIEIGTFTGYSAIAIASALPEDGSLICCDTSEEWTSIARRYWREAGLENKITLKLAPARQTLEALIGAGESGTFDIAFVDADKTSYDFYYEACLKLLRTNGLLAIDNTLWSGAVADPRDQEPDTQALRDLNDKIRDDSRVDSCLMSIADGITLIRKK